MLFNSLEFLVFFLVVTRLYFSLGWNRRWQMLLVASGVFYMCFIPVYILILLVTIAIDYGMALLIEQAAGGRRRAYLVVSIVATCLVLFVFKYYNFFVLTGNGLATAFGQGPLFGLAHIILPLGLSFHTFQSLSYVIEVYRGKQKAERNFGIYSLYVMYFPQLVAGPIERPQNLLHQFYEDHRFDPEEAIAGLQMMAWGFFKKMVVADRIAPYVNNVYGEWRTQPGLPLLLATLFFAVEIYADFSGYSSIAIGCSRILGIRLMQNFNTPYFARSISEFWQRWHISLSTWFRDYVYIPLGGNRVSPARLYVNLMITFLISGLWHGAKWTFVIWGAYHGLLLVIERMAKSAGITLHRSLRPLGWLATLALVTAGWVFFRAESVPAALAIFHKLGTDIHLNLPAIEQAVFLMTGDNTALPCMLTALFFIAVMFFFEFVGKQDAFNWATRLKGSRFWQMSLSLAAIEVVLFFGILRPSAFIYFQF
jgi:D-alanyl-lipoteichoic acid acyltransferase DltB (MBOAT superfamily)